MDPSQLKQLSTLLRIHTRLSRQSRRSASPNCLKLVGSENIAKVVGSELWALVVLGHDDERRNSQSQNFEHLYSVLCVRISF